MRVRNCAAEQTPTAHPNMTTSDANACSFTLDFQILPEAENLLAVESTLEGLGLGSLARVTHRPLAMVRSLGTPGVSIEPPRDSQAVVELECVCAIIHSRC